MKRKVIFALCIPTLIMFINLTGCSNEKDELNKSMVITDDVKADTDSELKVISSKTYEFKEEFLNGRYFYIEKDDGSTLIRDINARPGEENSLLVKLGNDDASYEYIEKIVDEYQNISKKFYLKNLADNNVLAIDWYTDSQYEFDKSFISNEESSYELQGKYLIEFLNGVSTNSFAADGVSWINLESNKSGQLKIPDDLTGAYYSKIIEDKLFIATISQESRENFNTKIKENGYIGFLLSDTVLVIDLVENKIIDKVTVGEFSYFAPIDNEHILITLTRDDEKVVQIYNLYNKTSKELIKYSNQIENGEGQKQGNVIFKGVELFPGKDKLYYCEDDGEKLYVKVAEINGMDIENVITAYEVEKKGEESIYSNYISIDDTGREMKIFNEVLLPSSKVISNVTKVKLSK